MKSRTKAALLLIACMMLTGCAGAEKAEKTFVSTFYPMYVFTKNVTRDVPGVEIMNLAGDSVGCLHDYQLKTRDMVMLEGASALVINGGGMESFADKVRAQYPDMPVIDAGEGIDMLCMDEHDHGDAVYNAHVWLNPELAAVQIRNIADGLQKADPQNAAAYQKNADAYIAQILALHEELSIQLAPLAGCEIITFHEAFSYFAQAYDLHIAGVIAGDSGEEPSTRQIAKTCDLVRDRGVRVLFIEPQYPAKSAETIARETGAAIYTLDPVVSGDGSLASYENLMRENARVLMEALKQ